MSDLKNWYLGGMVEAADKAEFKEDEHPRGKGGMFVKKGEQGISRETAISHIKEHISRGEKNVAYAENLSNVTGAPLEVVQKIINENPYHRQDKYIDLIDEWKKSSGIKKGEGGGKKVDTKGKEVDLSAKGLLIDAFKIGDSGAGGVSREKSAEMTLANWDEHSMADMKTLLGMYENMEGNADWRATMYSALQTYIQDRKDLEMMDDVGLGKSMADAINGKDKVRQHMIGEEQNRRYADKVSKMDDKELDDAVKSNESLVKKYGSGDDNPYVKSLEIAKAEKAKRGKNATLEDTADAVKSKISSAVKAYENAKTFKGRAEAARVVVFNACKLSSVDKSANESAMNDYVKLNFDNDSERSRYENGITKYDEDVVFDAMKHLGKEKALKIVDDVCNSGKYLFFKSPLSDRPHIGYADMKENMNRRNFSYDAYNDFMKDFEEMASK